MFSHIVVGGHDIPTAKQFYDATLGALGIPEGVIDYLGRAVYLTSTGIFMVSRPIDGGPATVANGGTIAFCANSPEQVRAWHTAGLSNHGVTCEDPPGIRSSPYGELYVAYLRDPTGNKLSALHRLG